MCIFAELTNTVEIQASSEAPVAGEPFTLTCICTSNMQPQVTWIAPNGETIEGDLQHENGLICTLTFNPLHTSQGGMYTCVSYIASPHSRQDAEYSVTVQSKHVLPTIEHFLYCLYQYSSTTSCVHNTAASWPYTTLSYWWTYTKMHCADHSWSWYTNNHPIRMEGPLLPVWCTPCKCFRIA